MNKSSYLPYLQGCLNIELDQHQIKVECEGQLIKLIFSSFTALRKFISLYHVFNEKILPHLVQNYAQHFYLKYYLKDVLVGESRSDLPVSWIGRYMGLENSKIYFKPLFRYFFRGNL